jgi:hypothetical protein
VFNNPVKRIDPLGLCVVDWTKHNVNLGWNWWSDVTTNTWGFWSDPELFRKAVNQFDEFLMAIPIDSVGINAGGGITLGFFDQAGPKGGLSTAIIIDADGNLAIISTRDIGLGTTEKRFNASLFVNVVVGLNGAMVKDYSGQALSVSGSAGAISAVYTIPVENNLGGQKSFFEIGFVPRPTSLGGKIEGGITISKGEGYILKNPFHETGKWWGDFFYDLLH